MGKEVDNQFNNAIIHYFSGTGNAKSVAYWMGENIYNDSIGVQIINIGTQEIGGDNKKSSIGDSSLVGFCYPTHGFNAPPIVLKYIWNFPRSKNKNKVFLLNTRAGLKLSKLFIPGLSGLALLLPALLLLLKGYKIVGYRPIDLPSNWISLHPGLKGQVIASIFTRCKKITNRVSEKILMGKKDLNGLWWLPVDLSLIIVSIVYYIYGRFVLSKTFIATANCNNCGLCIEACPVKAISLVDEKPYWSYKCESCMQCMNHCPTRAIETPHGFITLIWWFCFSMLPVLMYSLVTDFSNFNGLSFAIIFKLITLVASISVIFLAYRIIHILMKIKLINNIIKYTSLTTYSFWRRYKAPTRFN